MIILLALTIIISPIYAAKPYNCLDHYTKQYCEKTHQIPVINNTINSIDTIHTNNTISTNDTNNTIPTTSTVSRDVIKEIKLDIEKLNKELSELKSNQTEYDNLIPLLEQRYDQAKTKEAKSKADYENVPSGSKLDKWNESRDSLKALKDDLTDKKLDKLRVDARIREINKLLGTTTKELAVQQKEINKIDNSGIQTVGINLSNTCILMLQNNLTSYCPDYRMILDLKLDSSHKYSGAFNYTDGYYHREKPYVKNDYTLYDFHQANLIVDPSQNVAARIKMITITSNFNQYLLEGDIVKENNTRIIHKDRYVLNCNEAIINADSWLETIADTIQYLRRGCTGTLLNTVDVIHDNVTKQDRTTSAKYKHDQWLAEAKKKYKLKSYIGTNDNSTHPGGPLD